MAIGNYTIVHKVVDFEVRGPNNTPSILSVTLEVRPAARLAGGGKGDASFLFSLKPLASTAKAKTLKITFGLSELHKVWSSLRGAFIDGERIRPRV